MKILTSFDLETTGLPRDMALDDPQYPRMIQVGGVTWTSDDITHGRILNYVIQDDKRTSRGAEKVHGISDHLSRSKGIPEQVALGWITNSLRVSTDIVGWSLTFDLNIVRSALIRYGKDPNEVILPGKRVHDLQDLMTPLVGKTFDDGGQRWPTLSEGYEHLFGQPLYAKGTPHDAGRDSEACREIFMELWRQGHIEKMERLAA